jgi:hypothetical protein
MGSKMHTTLKKKENMHAVPSERYLVLTMIVIAALGLFLLQNRNMSFAKTKHGYISSHGAALAKNLVGEGRLIMFNKKSLSDDGKVIYDVYNRFPMFPFLLTGAAIMAMEPNLAAQIYIARQVMNVFLLAAMIVCYKLARELVRDRFLSLTVVFTVFSAHYILYYGDMIFNDAPALFGFVLMLYVMLKSQKSTLRVRSIVLLSIISISMNWQPYAVLLAWFLADLVNHIIPRKRGKEVLKNFFRRPSSIALFSAVSWGALILAAQLVSEWMIFGGSIQDVPSVSSILFRAGITPGQAYVELSPELNWINFIKNQIAGVTAMILPFSGLLRAVVPYTGIELRPIVIIVLPIVAVIFIRSFVIHRKKVSYTLLFVFLLSGGVWAILMRHYVAFHHFQSMYYIGVSIICFVFLVFNVRTGLSRAIAVITCVLFLLSVYVVNTRKDSIEGISRPVTAQFQSIYNKLSKNSRVFVDCDYSELNIGYHALHFFMSGCYWTSLEKAEYIVSQKSSYNLEHLTDNPDVNLYRNIPVVP